jgi:hypothetical protein
MALFLRRIGETNVLGVGDASRVPIAVDLLAVF